MKHSIRRIVVRIPVGSLLSILVNPGGWWTHRSEVPARSCSFCGKTYPDIQQLVAGPRAVAICDRCIRTGEQILREEGVSFV